MINGERRQGEAGAVSNIRCGRVIYPEAYARTWGKGFIPNSTLLHSNSGRLSEARLREGQSDNRLLFLLSIFRPLRPSPPTFPPISGQVTNTTPVSAISSFSPRHMSLLCTRSLRPVACLSFHYHAVSFLLLLFLSRNVFCSACILQESRPCHPPHTTLEPCSDRHLLVRPLDSSFRLGCRRPFDYMHDKTFQARRFAPAK